MVKTNGQSLDGRKSDEFVRAFNNDGTLSIFSHAKEQQLEVLNGSEKCTKFHQKPHTENDYGFIFTLISACSNKSIAVNGKFTEFSFSDRNNSNFVPMTELATLEELVMKPLIKFAFINILI